jgi:hypothetical protein
MYIPDWKIMEVKFVKQTAEKFVPVDNKLPASRSGFIGG